MTQQRLKTQGVRQNSNIIHLEVGCDGEKEVEIYSRFAISFIINKIRNLTQEPIDIR